MNISLTQEIYNALEQHLKANSKYSPKVLRKALTQSKKFPLVVLTEENNSFSSGTLQFKTREIVDSIFWEVNIYATNQTLGNRTISNVEICDELKALVDEVMSNKFKLTRSSCRPTPNLDETIYRVTMRYEGKILVNKNRII